MVAAPCVTRSPLPLQGRFDATAAAHDISAKPGQDKKVVVLKAFPYIVASGDYSRWCVTNATVEGSYEKDLTKTVPE
ncbi:MAG: hypothetical protein IT209_09505 [Armatimonadetes bacterium]|nr:hypothetical protein [Armatimonadota bacterium]